MDKKFVMSIAAMAALTLVSCSSDDLDSFSDNSSKNEAISFDGYLGRSAVAVNGTRGSEVKIGNLQTDGFGVFGKYTPTEGQASDLFINQQVTYDKSATPAPKWTYSPLKFWPAKGKIDFYAYAPYNYAGKNTTLTGTSISFEVYNTVANQKDLLWTNATSQITEDITKKKVNFQFHHALSRLGYNVTLSGDYFSSGATFTVNKITLAGSSDGTKKAFYKTGTIDLSKIVTKDNTQKNKEDLSKTNTETGLWTAEPSDGNKQNFDLVSSAQTLDQTGIKSGDNYLFVIPQDFSGTDELYVYVEYTINYGGTTGSVTNKVYKQIKKHFLQGNAYMLNLTLGLPIEFDVDVTSVGAGVDGWGTDEGINIGSDGNLWDGIK